MDAQVSYAFHSERKMNPEKFKNQLVNQVRKWVINLRRYSFSIYFSEYLHIYLKTIVIVLCSGLFVLFYLEEKKITLNLMTLVIEQISWRCRLGLLKAGVKIFGIPDILLVLNMFVLSFGRPKIKWPLC